MNSIALRTGMTDGSTLQIRLSSAQRVFEHRHWSPGLGTHERYKTGFQCLRFTRQPMNSIALRTGKTEKGEHSPNPSLQCAASLRAETLESRTLSAIEIHNWIPVSLPQKAPHWKDGKGDYSKSVSAVRSESSALRGTRHWSPGLGRHLLYRTGFQCLRFRKLRTGKTDVRASTPSLQCRASLRAQTLESRTLYSLSLPIMLAPRTTDVTKVYHGLTYLY
jgi:hypothetical protein